MLDEHQARQKSTDLTTDNPQPVIQVGLDTALYRHDRIWTQQVFVIIHFKSSS